MVSGSKGRYNICDGSHTRFTPLSTGAPLDLSLRTAVKILWLQDKFTSSCLTTARVVTNSSKLLLRGMTGQARILVAIMRRVRFDAAACRAC